jgi:uncharacterized membrane protein YsdA (DUF1294 family)
MPVVRILVGVALFTLGRRLYWLFVAGVGFVVAMALATRLLQNQPEWVILILALVAGVIGALLAVFLQRVAVGIAGFLAGGYLVLSLIEIFGLRPGELSWIPFLIGGILGAILAAALFDWALILLSSLTGASLLAQSIPVEPSIRILLFLGALVLGILVQAGMMRGEKPS